MRTARNALLGTVLALAFALAGTGVATAHPAEIGTPSYPWVQPPAWVGSAPAVSPGASYAWVQPPIWIPIA
jgi:hypothetical protein